MGERSDDIEPMFNADEESNLFILEPFDPQKSETTLTRRFAILKKIFFCCRCLKVIRNKEWTPEIRTLVVTFILFGLITAAQFVAALLANSLALMSDCASMLIDTVSYMGNISAECSDRDQLRKEKQQLMASGLSLTVLLGITGYVIYNATERLLHPDAGHHGIVDGKIVFIFAVFGLLFDFISMCSFYYWAKGSTGEVNMCSALLHVGADTVRSSTTLAESILIVHFSWDGRATDAWASIIVSILITIASIGGLCTWFTQLRQWIKKKTECFVPVSPQLEDNDYVDYETPGEGLDHPHVELSPPSNHDARYKPAEGDRDDDSEDVEYLVNPFIKNRYLSPSPETIIV